MFPVTVEPIMSILSTPNTHPCQIPVSSNSYRSVCLSVCSSFFSDHDDDDDGARQCWWHFDEVSHMFAAFIAVINAMAKQMLLPQNFNASVGPLIASSSSTSSKCLSEVVSWNTYQVCCGSLCNTVKNYTYISINVSDVTFQVEMLCNR